MTWIPFDPALPNTAGDNVTKYDYKVGIEVLDTTGNVVAWRDMPATFWQDPDSNSRVNEALQELVDAFDGSDKLRISVWRTLTASQTLEPTD